MIQAVVWDLGRVLIEFDPEAFYDREIGETRRKQLFQAVDLHAYNLRVDEGEPLLETFQEAARAAPEFTTEIMFWATRWIEMASPSIPGSVALLEQLKAQGTRLLALTNFGVDTFEIASAHYPFLGLFDELYVSGRLKQIKPDAGIYDALEQGCGLPPESLLFTDDRPENIAAAAARGWKTHLFEGPQGWADCLAHHGVLPEETPA
ncbi:HAD family hydrolase [Thalassovita sp.]|jgi:2-haloacid dehalogenase|uniref:HAD family hydrolase n=1 Tax=Thalassovita sp. TaxID=1979401 RepID=UPI003B5B75F7